MQRSWLSCIACPVPLVSRVNVHEPLFCRLDGNVVVWVSRKVPGAAGCSHLALAGVLRARIQSSHLL